MYCNFELIIYIELNNNLIWGDHFKLKVTQIFSIFLTMIITFIKIPIL